MLVVGIVVMVALGVAFEVTQSDSLRVFDLDRERHAAAAWSAFLLLLGVALSIAAMRTSPLRWHAATFGLLLIVLAMDEWIAVHERVHRNLGLPWQVLYVPLVILVAAATVSVLRSRAAPGLAKAALVAAGSLWGVSAVLEVIQNSASAARVSSSTLMVLEESLEMVGAVMFVVALLAIVLDARSARPDGRQRS